jgi:hypothetical protein
LSSLGTIACSFGDWEGIFIVLSGVLRPTR